MHVTFEERDGGHAFEAVGAGLTDDAFRSVRGAARASGPPSSRRLRGYRQRRHGVRALHGCMARVLRTIRSAASFRHARLDKIMPLARTPLDAQVILDSLPLSVILLDQEGNVRHANAAARRLASVVNPAVTEGLLSLVEGPPPEVQAPPQAAGDGWEDRRACALEGGGSLGIVRQWRSCADGSELTSVTIRPASALQPAGAMAGPEQEK